MSNEADCRTAPATPGLLNTLKTPKFPAILLKNIIKNWRQLARIHTLWKKYHKISILFYSHNLSFTNYLLYRSSFFQLFFLPCSNLFYSLYNVYMYRHLLLNTSEKNVQMTLAKFLFGENSKDICKTLKKFREQETIFVQV